MSQVGTAVAVAAAGPEVVIVRILKAFCDGGIGFQPVNFLPFHGPVFPPDLPLILSHHAGQHGAVRFFIIGIIFQLCARAVDYLFGRAAFLRLFQGFCRRFFHFRHGAAVKLPAQFGRRIGKKADPAQPFSFLIGFHVLFVGKVQRLAGHRKIHPSYKIPLPLRRILPAGPRIRKNRLRLSFVRPESGRQDQNEQKFNQDRRPIFFKPHGCPRAFSLFYEGKSPL